MIKSGAKSYMMTWGTQDLSNEWVLCYSIKILKVSFDRNSLANTDLAISHCKAALENNPNDPTALERLQEAESFKQTGHGGRFIDGFYFSTCKTHWLPMQKEM
jgi:hypothetical protein